MSNIEICLDKSPQKENDQILRDGMLSFNEDHLHDKAEQVSVYAIDNNEIVGGAIVWIHRDAFYIDTFWMTDQCRGQGAGHEIMNKIEAYAREKEVGKIFVDTFSFQAETFYQKFNFNEIGRAPEYLLGHDRIFMRKDLKI